MPATAAAAPTVSDDEVRLGFIDPPLLDAMRRFAFLANVTGTAAGVAPVGSDQNGMPVVYKSWAMPGSRNACCRRSRSWKALARGFKDPVRISGWLCWASFSSRARP